jgi:hypothetical protein
MHIDLSYNIDMLNNRQEHQLKITIKITFSSRNSYAWVLKNNSANVNAHLEMYHMYRVSAPTTRQLTDRHTHGHQIFYCFIVFRDLNNVQKSHKKWVYKNFIFRMNSILRHSNASRSNTQETVEIATLIT